MAYEYAKEELKEARRVPVRAQVSQFAPHTAPIPRASVLTLATTEDHLPA